MIINYPRLYDRFYQQPLLIAESGAHAIHASLWPRMTSGTQITISEQELQAARPTKMKTGMRATSLFPDAEGHMYSLAKPGVACVAVSGILGKNMDAFDMMCGGCPVDAVRTALAQAASAEGIRAVVCDFSSPGGEVTGIAELGATIRQLVQESGKTVYGFTDSQSCSAAYWLMSQCQEIVCTPSAILGSIGVYVAWLDPSVAMQMQGYSLQIFKAGDHKAMGMPGLPMTTEQRGMIQSRVDAVYQKFTAAVTSTRPQVATATMQGQVFTGEDSVANGLTDALVNSWDEFLTLV